MSKVRKLTPSILKRIINEEKQKILKESKAKPRTKTAKKNKKQNSLTEQFDNAIRLALLEAKHLAKAKRLKAQRMKIKSQIKNK